MVMAPQVILKKQDLIFVSIDYWDRPVYEHKNDKYYKDIHLKGTKNNIPNILYDSADNTFCGEPNNPYKFE